MTCLENHSTDLQVVISVSGLILANAPTVRVLERFGMAPIVSPGTWELDGIWRWLSLTLRDDDPRPLYGTLQSAVKLTTATTK